MSRKIIFNLAMSLDGYIVDENEKFDWITGDGTTTFNTGNQFDFEKFIDSLDIVIMGRVSYEIAGTGMFKGKHIIVVTSKKMETKEGIEFFNGNILEYVNKLKAEAGIDIWLFGGSMLASAFIQSERVDEYIVGIVPIILGKGKKLFLEDNPRIKLEMTDYSINEGLVILSYKKRT